MKRRDLLLAAGAAGLSAGLAAPRWARAQGAGVLRFIPQIDLAFLDPHFTTAYITRGHGHLVFDTLYGLDAQFRPHPQMVQGHVVERDGLLWTLTLRDGLLWHDGERVLARDCVASIRRWARRDALGGALMERTEELSAPDDRTIRFRLSKPFPLLPATLGKVSSPMPAMMPERLANTDPFRQITEMVGSGPFRFLANERVAGSRNVYVRNERYVPRAGGPLEWNAGPKIVTLDRVEWTTIPDAATKVAAIQRGEQDWWENPTHDLMPLLRRDRRVVLANTNPTGAVNMMRPNHLQPPFNNPAFRRAILHAIDQAAMMQAIVGNNPADYHVPHGIFCPGTPMASEAGLEPLMGPRDLARAREMVRASGYGGEKVAMLVAMDYPQFKAIGEVAADMFQKVGVNVDYVATDWGSMLQRRTNRGPVEQGGWSVFNTGWEGSDHMDPSNHFAIRGNGNDQGAWPGWSVSERLEQLRNAWFDAPTLAEQQRICRELQVQCMQDVPSIPLGQFQQPTAHRTSVQGVKPGFPTFWGVRKV